MSTAAAGSVPTLKTTCPSCGAPQRDGSQFCGSCGTAIAAGQARARFLERLRYHPRFLVLSVAAIAGVVIAVTSLVVAQGERAARQHQTAALHAGLVGAQQQLSVLERENAALAHRLAATQKSVSQTKAGVAPLAARILGSVFTVVTPSGLGTAWAAWSAGGVTYLVTANHVVEDALLAGTHEVTIRQKARTWRGEIGATDSVNDLAVVKVNGIIAPPLWQKPNEAISPLPGDELLLVGSPYGLEGTVTRGVVSRVTYDSIQTDAAANPGNSGGPAVDSSGEVVGILLSGGGENLNFTVPIQRACVTLRHC
jgi:S1-C subfamily serine protease